MYIMAACGPQPCRGVRSTALSCAQVTGEAMYTDDFRHTPDTLHAALVVSTKPHARLTSVDPAAALKVGHPTSPARSAVRCQVHVLHGAAQAWQQPARVAHVCRLLSLLGCLMH